MVVRCVKPPIAACFSRDVRTFEIDEQRKWLLKKFAQNVPGLIVFLTEKSEYELVHKQINRVAADIELCWRMFYPLGQFVAQTTELSPGQRNSAFNNKYWNGGVKLTGTNLCCKEPSKMPSGGLTNSSGSTMVQRWYQVGIPYSCIR
ncbi:hypothetical protein DPX16_10479 [Anabarilius grahami]|uniref:Uncharacterized protein n=1 Tax=Anabarilius grahami TaxID=495550 RepID=A0A3N0Z6I2_ANAGA|nr:hypothetical protein DPX16_10479 [Anabarilius grahami]